MRLKEDLEGREIDKANNIDAVVVAEFYAVEKALSKELIERAFKAINKELFNNVVDNIELNSVGKINRIKIYMLLS